jgi:hypothetical protein
MDNKMTIEEREKILQEALGMSNLLAEAMANPIQTGLLYQTIGRKLLEGSEPINLDKYLKDTDE